MSRTEQPIIAICGKGGVGKTVLSALLARALMDSGVKPILLVDADPVCGLTAAIGESGVKTIGAVREEIIASLKEGEDAKKRVSEKLDYFVLEALAEREGYSLFAMGRNAKKGCYCPVNVLLRDAIDLIVDPFSAVLIDAEAGIEQINRQVTRRVSEIIVVTDGSVRSLQTMELITEMVDSARVSVVANRSQSESQDQLPTGVALLGRIPEDEELRQFDREGRSLWELPPDNPSVAAALEVVRALGFETEAIG